ncbi:hypothetical protein J7T55_007070 [Diaporthe amygdali]|uniref:uncharacterized protein n=1 Tax=Phomopsis amygdali TaxID=1214568 RepID=UPI0022FEA0F5|nr:uncharacterized protein J7T55_007070 [Diaporthe amygdali]KAJ0107858.1 hypothetical protein J7T55_007070 [Diaporthe amygdali]
MASNNENASTTVPHYSENPSAFPMEGGCVCGHFRYRLEQAPMASHNCHCTACQRETGSAFSPNIIIEASSVTRLAPAAPTIPAHRGAPDTIPAAGPAPPPLAGDNSNGPPDDLLRVAIPSESGEGQMIVRCPRCFSAVWSEYVFGPPVMFIKSGTLDRAWLVEPDLHIYVRSKRPFVAIGDGKPQFQEYYDRAEVWRPEALERWAKVMVGVQKYWDSCKAGR